MNEAKIYHCTKTDHVDEPITVATTSGNFITYFILYSKSNHSSLDIRIFLDEKTSKNLFTYEVLTSEAIKRLFFCYDCIV